MLLLSQHCRLHLFLLCINFAYTKYWLLWYKVTFLSILSRKQRKYRELSILPTTDRGCLSAVWVKPLNIKLFTTWLTEFSHIMDHVSSQSSILLNLHKRNVWMCLNICVHECVCACINGYLCADMPLYLCKHAPKTVRHQLKYNLWTFA